MSSSCVSQQWWTAFNFFRGSRPNALFLQLAIALCGMQMLSAKTQERKAKSSDSVLAITRTIRKWHRCNRKTI